MDFEIDWISWFGMLFGPTLLLVSSLEITDSISWGVVGFIKNDLELGVFRYDWNDLFGWKLITFFRRIYLSSF